jgi:hypothetical protein
MKGLTYLAARDNATHRIDSLRPLTQEELDFDSQAAPVYSEAASRLELFQILRKNYHAWESLIRQMLTPGATTPDDVEINRLMLNFLTCAYSIVEHFECSYRRRFRHYPEKIAEYERLLEDLFKNSWACAFFMDFRNYVQHVGLPTRGVSRHETRSSVSISITQDSRLLLNESREWQRCGLVPERGMIDLVELTDEFFLVFVRNYGGLVARTFHPQLKKVDEFFRRLTMEVHRQYPNSRMGFMEDHGTSLDSLVLTKRITFSDRPNLVYEELGIAVE